MSRKKKTKALLIIVLSIALLAVIVLVFSPDARSSVPTTMMEFVASVFVTYNYYGEELSTSELQQMSENQQALHCVQVLTQTSRILRIANKFECFDSRAEANTFTP